MDFGIDGWLLLASECNLYQLSMRTYDQTEMMCRFTNICIAFCLWLGVCVETLAGSPLNQLRIQYPSLYKLYISNQQLAATLSAYAEAQGFRLPYEKLATELHEMIHIDSAAHQGYFIDGIYYEPYVNQAAWPGVSNQDIAPHMLPAERGLIFTNYVLGLPANHLGNVVDEINAYSHVVEFVCRNEPPSASKQVASLLGHLQLQEAYLRTLRIAKPDEYKLLARNLESRGAMVEITNRAWLALQSCGVEPGAIPSTEIEVFVALKSDPSFQ